MKNRRRRALVAAAGAVLALSAMPAAAQASLDAKHCLEPPYTPQLVAHCACVAVATVGQTVLPGSQWSCL